LIKTAQNIIDFCGRSISWLTTFLVLLISLDVFLRKAFKLSKPWVIDLEWEIFAAIFLIGMSYTLQYDKHVRVDVFYTNFSDRKKAWVDLIGTIFLCIPWTLLLMQKSYNYAMNSWYIREGSANPGGLGARYLIKFVMVIGFCLLFLQAISLTIQSIHKIRS
jgi:TRAP-type mannitol/chloroaromatic compound transport system permease small subunit